MELYCEIGRLVSGRPEKGAAVAAAEYLCGAYPDVSGFSPRNLRRMREFYRTYESAAVSPPDMKPEKQKLSIQTLTSSINGEICDPYGDPVYVKESYQVSRTPPTVVRTQEDGVSQTIAPPPKILAKLLKWTVHPLEIFWWGEDYCTCQC